jgi:hypothetical protein
VVAVLQTDGFRGCWSAIHGSDGHGPAPKFEHDLCKRGQRPNER